MCHTKIDMNISCEEGKMTCGLVYLRNTTLHMKGKYCSCTLGRLNKVLTNINVKVTNLT